MKSFVLSLLLSLAAIDAFASNPYFGSRRVFSIAPTKNIVFMSQQTTEEKTAEEIKVYLNATAASDECEIEEEKSETQKLMAKVKDAGVAGIISYAIWEIGFWAFSVPVCILGYREVTGHWPDFSDSDDLSKLGAEAFAFVNFARFAVPLRIGLALSTTGWIQQNVVDRFMKKDDNYCEDPAEN